MALYPWGTWTQSNKKSHKVQSTFFREVDAYLSRIKTWLDESKPQLLLSFIKPHKDVISSTAWGWIAKTLSFAGIDIDQIKCHSPRSASTTKSVMSGLVLADFLPRGQCYRESTWQKFCNKPFYSIEEF